MLMLLFCVDEERYACECDQIVEILPRIPARPVPQAPPYVAGLLTYRGLPIPLVDFSALIRGTPSNNYLSTRIILFRKAGLGGKNTYLGLIAERVTDTIDRDPTEFSETGVHLIDAPFLGGILPDEKGVVHYVVINRLFESVEKLFDRV